MIREAKAQWKRGALVNLMWHACNPALAQPCGWDSTGVLSHLTDAQWQALLTDNSPINRRWKARMDEVAFFAGVAAGQRRSFFSAAARNEPGPLLVGRPTGIGRHCQLYRLTHDYLVQQKGLTNLIWVWDMQDFATLAADVQAYTPEVLIGDVIALDVYGGNGYTQAKYETMVTVAAGKPIAIGECQVLPTSVQLTAQPRWTFFMGWSELVFAYNSPQSIQALYRASNVLTLDRLLPFVKP